MPASSPLALGLLKTLVKADHVRRVQADDADADRRGGFVLRFGDRQRQHEDSENDQEDAHFHGLASGVRWWLLEGIIGEVERQCKRHFFQAARFSRTQARQARVNGSPVKVVPFKNATNSSNGKNGKALLRLLTR